MAEQASLGRLVFGRLTWDALPLHDPILLATLVAVAIGGVLIVAALTYFRAWGPLWRDWITSIDHKKIGVMYVILGLVMLLRGFSDAVMMRAQQAVAFGDAMGYLPPHHYDQIFTAHGVIMVLFVAMPLVTGLMNFVVPLQIGARDVAFPFLNNFSFWMTACGAGLVMMSLFVGEFARTGWLAYPPLSGIIASPDVGVDYYIWSIQVAGVGTAAIRREPHRDHREDARTRNERDEDAHLHLDRALHEHPDRGHVPGADRRARAVVAGSLCRHQFLHERSRRQPDDVRQPDLDLGASGGVHPDPARFRHLLRSRVDLLRQATFRLHLDGVRDGRHHAAVVSRLAAPFLHDGLGCER